MSFLCMSDSFATVSYKVILSSIGRLNVSWRRDLRRSRFGERFSSPSANGSSSEWRFVAPYTRSISRIPSSWMFVSWAISAMVGERPSRWKYSCWVRMMRTWIDLAQLEEIEDRKIHGDYYQTDDTAHKNHHYRFNYRS